MKVKLKSGKCYSFCSCGLSLELPYCDNAHRVYNQANNTEYKSVKITSNIESMVEITCSRWKLIEDK